MDTRDRPIEGTEARHWPSLGSLTCGGSGHMTTWEDTPDAQMGTSTWRGAEASYRQPRGCRHLGRGPAHLGACQMMALAL